MLDDYIASVEFTDYLKDAFEIVSYASKGFDVAKYSYDLIIELEAYNDINNQITNTLQYLYQNAASEDVKKVAGELWSKIMSSKKDNLEDVINQIYVKIGKDTGEDILGEGIKLISKKLGIKNILAYVKIGITLGNFYSDQQFSTSDIREQLTMIEATNEVSIALADMLESKLDSYKLRWSSAYGSYDERAKDAKDIIYYSKLLLATRQKGEKAYYLLKETAYSSLFADGIDDIFSLLGMNLKQEKFGKIEDWYKSCCADFETAKKILYNDIDSVMFENLYEIPETEDFVIVDGKLIAYNGHDASVYVPYDVHTIGTEAFNGKVLMTRLSIRGTTMESRSVSNCGDLYELFIPKSVTTMQAEAIYNCPNVTIYGYIGTAAETYAKNNNIPFHSLGNSFTDDGIYVNDYTLSEGTLDLDGKTMYVGGDFLHTGGTLNIGSGELVIFGDYYSYYYGNLNMNNYDGKMIVHGDFMIESSSNTLSAGVLELKGNFTQHHGSSNGNKFNFSPFGTHKVILSGTGEQIVTFENPSDIMTGYSPSYEFYPYSEFNILEVKNITGKVKFNQLAVKTLIGDIISDYDIILYNNNISLENQKIKTSNLYMGGYGRLELCENSWIEGNLYQGNNSTIIINGTAQILGEYKSNYYASLNMTNENAYLTVHGDFTIESSSNALSAGVLELKGNFTQHHGSSNGNKFNFSPFGTHNVILSGTGEQIVKFENPTNSYFNILINKNPNGVIFTTDYKYNELQIICPFVFEMAEYNAETNQIHVVTGLDEELQSLNGTVLISLYDENNRLVECQLKKLSELEILTFNGLNNYNGKYIIKAFYWSDINALNPLCSSIKKELISK